MSHHLTARTALVILTSLFAASCGMATGITDTALPPTAPAQIEVADGTVTSSTLPATGAPTAPVEGEVAAPAPVVVEFTELIDPQLRGACLYQELQARVGGVGTYFIEDTLAPAPNVETDEAWLVLSGYLVDALRACPGVDGGLVLLDLHGADAVGYATAVFADTAALDTAAQVEEDVEEEV